MPFSITYTYCPWLWRAFSLAHSWTQNTLDRFGRMERICCTSYRRYTYVWDSYDLLCKFNVEPYSIHAIYPWLSFHSVCWCGGVAVYVSCSLPIVKRNQMSLQHQLKRWRTTINRITFISNSRFVWSNREHFLPSLNRNGVYSVTHSSSGIPNNQLFRSYIHYFSNVWFEKTNKKSKNNKSIQFCGFFFLFYLKKSCTQNEFVDE